MLDSRRMLYFLRIAEFGSFSRAAKSLGVAQPALSHHMKLLEEYLGVVLLVRRQRGVVVTEAGENLLAHARAIISRIEEAEQDLRGYSREIVGTIKLGLAKSLAATLTPPLLKSLRDRHPGITLVIAEGVSTELAEWVRTERLDLAVNLDGVSEHPTTPLFSEDIYLVGNAGTLDHFGGTITFDQAITLPLILPARPQSMRMLIERAASTKGMSFRPAFEIDGFEPIKAATEAGLGFSILSWTAVQREHLAGLLSIAKLVDPPIRRTVVLDAAFQSKLSRAAQAVSAVISDTVADLSRTDSWRGALRLQLEDD